MINVYLYYSYRFISTALMRHVSAFKGPSSGSRLIHFHSQVNRMCTRYKILEVKVCWCNTKRREICKSALARFFLEWNNDFFFTVDIIKFFYLPTDAQKSCFKRILKFTLKQLLHVSVQSPSSESVLFELAKVIDIKIIS